MRNSSGDNNPEPDLKCPECRATLKKRRSRKVDKCEMVCGGCGQTFDVCDWETVQEIQNKS